MNTALLLIDIQNDYFPGGRNPLVGSEAAGEFAGRRLALARRLGLPVIFIQHISTRPGASFFLPGTPGIEIHPSVASQPGEIVLQKHYPNSFRETPLLDTLRGLGVERLVICGMMTHMCVDSSVRAANDLGFEVRIVADACATKDLSYSGQTIPAASVHASFLAALNGSFGKVMTGDEVLENL
jgi:nicotinamidase-related amidase